MLSAFLQRLGLEAEPPSAAALFRLHRAHIERIPYETTWISLGELWDISIDSSLERIVLGGRGGYCFHLNGSLSRVLAELGYDVSLHVGGVHRGEPDASFMTNHLVLLVHGLATDENPSGTWYVDAGLGDALYEPLPLLAGTYEQGPFTFVLTETPGGVGDWHFAHDPRGSFPGMSFQLRHASIGEFAARHQQLSTSPESGFVKTVCAQRREQHKVTVLRALTLSIRDQAGVTSRVVTDRAEWFALLASEFSVQLDGVEPQALDRLWSRANEAHQAFVDSKVNAEAAASS